MGQSVKAFPVVALFFSLFQMKHQPRRFPMYYRAVAVLCAALFLCFFPRAVLAQVFVPNKGAPFPKDMVVELVFPQTLMGDIGKRKAEALTKLVKQSFHPEGKRDRGPYRARCTFLLEEWDLEGELGASFKLECYSAAMWEGDRIALWVGSVDEPDVLMGVIHDLAKLHTDRLARKPPEPTPPKKRTPPEEYLQHDWSIST